MKDTVNILVQARLGSVRLPGKVMSDICGVPMIELMIRRLKLAKRVDKIISKNLKSGYLIDTFNFSQNKDTKFIISLTNEMSENLKTKKYMKLINSGQKLIKRYREVANKYENVFFLPIQEHIDKDNETLYTDKYDGVHYSNKGMQILAKPLSEIIKKD